MSLNESALQDAAVDMFYHLGEDAVYYPSDGPPVACKVNVEKDFQTEPDGFTMQARGEQITIEGLIRILGKVPVAKTPNRPGETFVVQMPNVGAVTYEVKGILANDERFVTCSVKVLE
jgi:hypothetical protein